MNIQHTVFSVPGDIREDFFAATSTPGTDFASEAADLLQAYDESIKTFSCSQDSEILLRFHLSDITNQAAVLQKLLHGRLSFISMVGQPPADGSRLALEAWHWSDVKKLLSSDKSTLQATGSNYRAVWFQIPELTSCGSFDQTAEEFRQLQACLQQHKANVADHTVRTWLYNRDVDNNYAGLVKARNEFFRQINLTADTHFIASTGIEAQHAAVNRLVKMDSLSYPDLQTGQMQYLTAPEMLSPTALYGVSFERGTRLIFGDRSHYFISGTASIDKAGMVVHINDVKKQTVRMMDNIEALLAAGGAHASDIVSGTLYLRDLADAHAVKSIIAERWGDRIPLVTVKAPVCRPTWLVELECLAINSCGNKKYPPLC